MLDPFSHLLLVVNSALNIVFYGIFNQKFREVAKKEFTRCCPKAAARLSPSRSKRVIVLPKQNPISNQTNIENHRVTEMTQVRNNSSKCEELIPLTSTAHPVNSSFNAEKTFSECKEPVQSTLQVSVVNSNISVAALNNKLLTDSSTQIPNSEYATTNLKKSSAITTNTKEQGNNDKIGTIDKVGSNGNSIKSASSISKKASSVNEECMNTEKGIVEQTDFDCIAKYPSSSFNCNEGADGHDKNGLSMKVFHIVLLYVILAPVKFMLMYLFVIKIFTVFIGGEYNQSVCTSFLCQSKSCAFQNELKPHLLAFLKCQIHSCFSSVSSDYFCPLAITFR